MEIIKKSFLLEKHGDTQYFTIPDFTATDLTTHVFTTTLGGVSQQCYASLNLGLHVGDDPQAVVENRKRICATLGIQFNHLVAGVQVHGNKVHVVTKMDLGKGCDSMEKALPDTDALITNLPNIPLSSYYADCVPLLFLDPVKKAIGLAHAGWKGTVQRIGCKTIEKMKESFGSLPQDIIVGIGPSIGPCCYMVDNYVVSAFKKSFAYWQKLLEPCDPEHWKLDLWEANRLQLLEVGIKNEHITVAKVCTACHDDILYSYRSSGGCTGRMASIIMLK